MSNDSALTGFDDLNYYLSTFTKKVEKRILKGSLSRGAIVIKKQAKLNLRQKTVRRSGTLFKAIKHKTLKGERATVRVFVEKGSGAKYDGWYAHIIEGGARPHPISPRKKGEKLRVGKGYFGKISHPGIQARPFMKPALEQKAKEAIQAIGKRMAELIEKELSK